MTADQLQRVRQAIMPLADYRRREVWNVLKEVEKVSRELYLALKEVNDDVLKDSPDMWRRIQTAIETAEEAKV